MWVIKLGGSLADSQELPEWLEIAAQEGGGHIVIVPGGGPFADQVRQMQARWKYSDRAAHYMALLAMEQYGCMLASFHPRLCLAGTQQAIRSALQAGKVPVWLPASMVLGEQEIPNSWEVTSDSLAAWLAGHLSASGLVLVKSRLPQNPVVSIQEQIRDHLLDAAFEKMTAGAAYAIRILCRTQHRQFREMLKTGQLAGCIVEKTSAPGVEAQKSWA